MISAAREPQRSDLFRRRRLVVGIDQRRRHLGRVLRLLVLARFRLGDRLAVGVGHLPGVAALDQAAGVEPERAIAQLLDQPEVVAHQHQRPPGGEELLDPAQAAVRERRVAHRQHLVDQQDLGVGVDRHREAEPHVHARRVVLDRLVDEAFETGEAHDVVVARLDLGALQAEHRSVDEDVLATRDLGVEAGAELDQRRHTAAGLRRCRWWVAAGRPSP